MNLERVEAILRLLTAQEHVGEIEVEGEGWRLQARKAPGALLPEPPPLLTEEEPAPRERHVLRAGLVGIYRAAERPPRPGEFVARGSSVGTIDSLGIPSPITAEDEGYLAETLVEDGEAVEYGQELFVLTPEPQREEAAE